MIQLDQNALRDCIRDAIKEELHIFISGIRNTVDNTESTSSEKLLTKKEMADELDISLVSLTDWMKQGKIPYMRMGKRIYFKKNEVVNSMANFNHKKGGK
ncbi:MULTISPECIES: helix-turn-helix domain-containing protein [Sphingobacteriaceae]|uniref:helix-turn-helix domain-containing protein n=1 Tax=Sphingobacteriaceae TaxID=84566 RepID=UPI00265CEB9C|nr:MULTISPECIES: helix-turn-helix domain-containing protein [Sphingobacteriaceae]MEC3880433.1 helix-turn-helix domain-containing protein [Parapedobacter sp. 10938]WKK59311.1 helix-turn-helix domain-containing protein [Sphingobacterium sp. BN32]